MFENIFLLNDLVAGRGICSGNSSCGWLRALAFLEKNVEERVIQRLSCVVELSLQRAQELIHLFCAEKKRYKVAQSLQEASVFVTVIHAYGSLLLNRREVNQLGSRILKVIDKSFPESPLEIFAFAFC